jgi:hypothetical protein
MLIFWTGWKTKLLGISCPRYCVLQDPRRYRPLQESTSLGAPFAHPRLFSVLYAKILENGKRALTSNLNPTMSPFGKMSIAVTQSYLLIFLLFQELQRPAVATSIMKVQGTLSATGMCASLFSQEYITWIGR